MLFLPGNYTFSDNVVSVSRLRLITYPVRGYSKIILLDNVLNIIRGYPPLFQLMYSIL